MTHTNATQLPYRRGKSVLSMTYLQYALLFNKPFLYWTLDIELTKERLYDFVPHAIVKMVSKNQLQITACDCMRSQ